MVFSVLNWLKIAIASSGLARAGGIFGQENVRSTFYARPSSQEPSILQLKDGSQFAREPFQIDIGLKKKGPLENRNSSRDLFETLGCQVRLHADMVVVRVFPDQHACARNCSDLLTIQQIVGAANVEEVVVTDLLCCARSVLRTLDNGATAGTVRRRVRRLRRS